jgi:peptidoglycan/LPS O-acetylase OafA/YrhL
MLPDVGAINVETPGRSPRLQQAGVSIGHGPHARRFITLDAMRGVAAISVMFFHFLIGSDCTLFGKAFYAVDFFFILSGIVLLHSYGDVIAKGMSFSRYAKLRLIRLYPLYCVGLVLGVLATQWYIAGGFIKVLSLGKEAVLVLFALFFVPYYNNLHLPFVNGQIMTGTLFPFNLPSWSLFFELIASFGLFVVIRLRISHWHLFAASILVFVAAIIHYGSAKLGSAGHGLVGGSVRAALAFSAGMLIYQLADRPSLRRFVPPPGVSVVLTLLLFALPASCFVIGGMSFGFLRPAAIPLLVMFGLLANERTENTIAFVWLGRVSYGIYVIHIPVYNTAWLLMQQTGMGSIPKDHPLAMACAVGLLVLGAAHMLTVAIDEPARRLLRRGLTSTPRRLACPGG